MNNRRSWRDAYPCGSLVSILVLGNWLPGRVTRRTATGSPVVSVAAKRGVMDFAIDRKADICRGVVPAGVKERTE